MNFGGWLGWLCFEVDFCGWLWTRIWLSWWALVVVLDSGGGLGWWVLVVGLVGGLC